MFVETLDLVKAAFQSVSYGVNNKLLSIVTGSGHSIPPQIVTIESEIDNDNAAQLLTPQDDSTTPLIQIFLPHQNYVVSSDVISGTQDADIPVIARLVYKRTDTANGKTNFLYTLRAMRQCINSFIDDANESDRQLRNVQLMYFAQDIEVVEVMAKLGDDWITGGLKMIFRVRDINP